MTKIQVQTAEVLPGNIGLETIWTFKFHNDSGELDETRVVFKHDMERIKTTVPIEAVPAEVRKEAIETMYDMQDQLQMPGEHL